MTDYKIQIKFDGTNFTFTDEQTADGTIKKVFTHDTIRWNLVGIGPATNTVDKLIVKFNKNGDPFHRSEFDAPAGSDTDKGNLDYPTKKIYDYTVIAVLKDTHQVPKDPQIMFGDVSLGGISESLSLVGTAAKGAFQGLLEDLKANAALKRDPNAEFFPGGINNIQVQVTVPPGIIVSITVSGPEATPLIKATTGQE